MLATIVARYLRANLLLCLQAYLLKFSGDEEIEECLSLVSILVLGAVLRISGEETDGDWSDGDGRQDHNDYSHL